MSLAAPITNKVAASDQVTAVDRQRPVGVVKRQDNAAAQAATRISALDFTKGFLVLVMVLYHWLNYFVGVQGDFYRYLSFLPPSFICITGFLVAQVYFGRHQESGLRLARRLATRGLKLLGIFVALNVLISVLVPGSNAARTQVDWTSLAVLKSVFLTGNMSGGRLVAFYILVPISYVLILSAAVVLFRKYAEAIFRTLTLLSLASIVGLRLIGLSSTNLELVTIGLIGVCIGYVQIEKINQIALHPAAFVAAYVLYTAAIAIWNVNYPLQITGVLLSLALIYMSGSVGSESSRISNVLILLGKYSLFGYIAQIAILQGLRRVAGGNQASWALLTSFVAAVALTTFAVQATHQARRKSAVADRLYRIVFA